MPQQHTVEQGETLLTIAHRYGLRSWQVIWDDPANEDLRTQRPDPQVLAPGDVVVIPEITPQQHACDTSRRHTFTLPRPKPSIHVTLQDEEGEPYANCTYLLTAPGWRYAGETTAEGLVHAEVGVEVKEVALTLWRDPDEPEDAYTWVLNVGHLDPVSTVPGVQARLNNLGFRCGDVDGVMGPQTVGALRAFQNARGLEVQDGTLTDETRAALSGH